MSHEFPDEQSPSCPLSGNPRLISHLTLPAPGWAISWLPFLFTRVGSWHWNPSTNICAFNLPLPGMYVTSANIYTCRWLYLMLNGVFRLKGVKDVNYLSLPVSFWTLENIQMVFFSPYSLSSNISQLGPVNVDPVTRYSVSNFLPMTRSVLWVVVWRGRGTACCATLCTNAKLGCGYLLGWPWWVSSVDVTTSVCGFSGPQMNYWKWWGPGMKLHCLKINFKN